MDLDWARFSISWGEAVAAIVTLSAVGAAFGVAKYTERQTRMREREERQRRALTLAVAMHGELTLLYHGVNTALAMAEDGDPKTPVSSVEALSASMYILDAPLLDRIIESIAWFETELGADLAAAHSNLSSLRGTMRRPILAGELPASLAKTMLRNTASASRHALARLERALRGLEQLITAAGLKAATFEHIKELSEKSVPKPQSKPEL